ncbi:MAG: hypothetical protein IK130_02155 [Oscillospiraceae bacterium]|nr:hypothetical protein [Oscillospiraceae bacterium]
MNLNKAVAKIGSAIVTVTVFLFALFLIVDATYWSFFVCLLLPIGFIMMTAGLHHECPEDRRTAGTVGMMFAAVYCTLIMIVYFAQITSVANEQLGEQAAALINFKKYGLIFNLDLLGYGMMALSTFFTGLAMRAKNRADKALKLLLMLHGAFFPGCIIMPMTGVFAKHSASGNGSGGALALVIWCIYFLPVGILAFRHFGQRTEKNEKGC